MKVFLGALAALSATSCSTSSARSAARQPTTTVVTANICERSGDAAINDEAAQRALLDDSQLPGGNWTRRYRSCHWSSSSDSLLSVAECRQIAGDPSVRDESPVGSATATWFRAGTEVQVHQQAELFPNKRLANAVRTLLTSQRFPECVTALARAHALNIRTSSTRHVQVTRYDVGVGAAELHTIAQSAARRLRAGSRSTS